MNHLCGGCGMLKTVDGCGLIIESAPVTDSIVNCFAPLFFAPPPLPAIAATDSR